MGAQYEDARSLRRGRDDPRQMAGPERDGALWGECRSGTGSGNPPATVTGGSPVKTPRRTGQPDQREQARLWLESQIAEGRLKPLTREQLVRVAQIIRAAVNAGHRL